MSSSSSNPRLRNDVPGFGALALFRRGVVPRSTAIPFPATQRYPYNRENYQATIAGPFIQNKLTLTLAAQRNNNFQTAVSTPVNLATGLLVPNQIPTPNLRSNFNIRGQYAVNNNNTLNFNLELQSQARSNQGIGQFDLVDNGFS